MSFDEKIVRKNNPELLVMPSEKDIKDLRGIELIYAFHNSEDGTITEVPAYVAQADINKGITIRGKLPFEDEDGRYDNPDDVILSCCNRNGISINDPFYVYIINKYKMMILSGVFNPSYDKYSTPENILDGSCAFN